MADVKGRNGGARPDAGRKPKTADPATTEDSKEFLTMAMQGLVDPSPAQLKAAIALLSVQHAKKSEAAKPVAPERPAGGKYAMRQGPRLVASK